MIETDYLVIGSGLAGLTFALRAAEHGRVMVATKRAPADANTAYAQGGVAGALDPDDTVATHVEDTLRGRRRALPPRHRRAVRARGARAHPLVRQRARRPVRSRRRRAPGARARGRPHRPPHRPRQGHAPAGRSRRRCSRGVAAPRRPDHDAARPHGDRSADDREVRRARTPCSAPTCSIRRPARSRRWSRARSCWRPAAPARSTSTRRTPTSRPATAWRWPTAWARASRNMEFFQFHPTCLYHPAAKSFLITEALRGEGGILRLRDGTAFMSRYHEMKDLAPARRRLARHRRRDEADGRRLRRPRHDPPVAATSWSSASPTSTSAAWSWASTCARSRSRSSRPRTTAAAASSSTSTGASTVRNLYAIGEVSMTGLHGACRLASNSLLEAMVFARARRRRRARRRGRRARPQVAPWYAGEAGSSDEAVVVSHNWDEIRRLMWNYVGIVRSDRRLERAARRIELIRDGDPRVLLERRHQRRPRRAAQHRARRRT